MIGFFEISIVVLLAFAVLAGLVYGGLKAWNFIVATRRKHRLEREEDERNHRKLMAQDFSEIMQMPGETPLSFTEYAIKKPDKFRIPR